ncbi:MAG: glycosyltransferase family 4 protein [Planctomycetales bacterium]|nr:glycosyltransferase family 4 protein [Planctomycetales bacterium]
MSRVTLVFEYPTLFGGEMSLLAALPALQHAGFEMTALAPAPSPLAAALAEHGVRVTPFRWRDDQQRRPLAELRADLATFLQQQRPVIVHANSLSSGRVLGPVASELQLPSLAHLRDILGLKQQALTDLNRHGCLVAVSQATRDFHVAQGLDASRVRVVYNGVDLARFHPRERSGWLHRELGIPADAPLVGTIGQISLRKGQDVFLAAARRVAEENDAAQFVIVGSRYSEKEESRLFEARLHAMAAEPPLHGRVHFLGLRDSIEQLLPELSLLVHTARQEPLGRVLLEAAACGLPVVATDVGGTWEIFPADSGAALLVSSDDPPATGQGIAALLADQPSSSRMGNRARATIETRFDARTAGDNLAEIYRELAG